jgi:DegV family protein with EDD domain
MPVAIVTDSNVSLPAALLTELPIFIVPLEIHHDGKVYQDGLDLTTSAFYALQEHGPSLPTTSAPKPGAFLDAYTKAAEIADDIVCITLSDALSATYEAAVAAQQEAASSLPKARIQVIDSRSAGTAQGLVALEAARLAATGEDVDAVTSAVRASLSEAYLYGYLQSLYYVWKSGRVPRVLMWMGKLLDVKPVLQLSAGKIGMVERPRTEGKALKRVAALAARAAGDAPVSVAVMHANAPERATELAEVLQDGLHPVELFVTEFTPVIGAHTGPGLVGCALLRLPV